METPGEFMYPGELSRRPDVGGAGGGGCCGPGQKVEVFLDSYCMHCYSV